MKITLTGQQLIDICHYDKENDEYEFVGMEVYDCPPDTYMSHIDWIELNDAYEPPKVVYATKRHEVALELTDTMQVIIYKEIDSIDELQ